MELEVKEDRVSPLLDLLYDGRSCRIEQLHADLYERTLLRKLIKKLQCLCFARKVAGNDYIFCHNVILLLCNTDDIGEIFNSVFIHYRRQFFNDLRAGKRIDEICGADLHCGGAGHHHLDHIFCA